jgi:hypothetical protein
MIWIEHLKDGGLTRQCLTKANKSRGLRILGAAAGLALTLPAAFADTIS